MEEPNICFIPELSGVWTHPEVVSFLWVWGKVVKKQPNHSIRNRRTETQIAERISKLKLIKMKYYFQNIPGEKADEMVDESCSQTSPPVRLPDEDRVYNVQGVALKTSCSRHWLAFTLEGTEANWCSLHPAKQHLKVWEDQHIPSILTLLTVSSESGRA